MITREQLDRDLQELLAAVSPERRAAMVRLLENLAFNKMIEDSGDDFVFHHVVPQQRKSE